MALWAFVGLIAVSGCHPRAVPLLGYGPIRADDPTLFEDAVSAARTAGHPPVSTDPTHGSFVVRAYEDPTRSTIFVVQCSRDGYLTIVPTGPHVVRIGDRFLVDPDVRNELAELVAALERAIPERS